MRKVFECRYHAKRAFGAVFESNFDGGTYSKIRVERAKTFEAVGDKWKLKSAGKIILNKQEANFYAQSFLGVGYRADNRRAKFLFGGAD